MAESISESAWRTLSCIYELACRAIVCGYGGAVSPAALCVAESSQLVSVSAIDYICSLIIYHLIQSALI